MICNQLMEVNRIIVQLTPRPSLSDWTRVVCGNCDRTVSCPVLTVEQIDAISQSKSNSDSDSTPSVDA